jgi:hypothetical protein
MVPASDHRADARTATATAGGRRQAADRFAQKRHELAASISAAEAGKGEMPGDKVRPTRKSGRRKMDLRADRVDDSGKVLERTKQGCIKAGQNHSGLQDFLQCQIERRARALRDMHEQERPAEVETLPAAQKGGSEGTDQFSHGQPASRRSCGVAGQTGAMKHAGATMRDFCSMRFSPCDSLDPEAGQRVYQEGRNCFATGSNQTLQDAASRPIDTLSSDCFWQRSASP